MKRRLAAVAMALIGLGAMPLAAEAETPRKAITCVYPYVPSEMHICVFKPDRLPIPPIMLL